MKRIALLTAEFLLLFVALPLLLVARAVPAGPIPVLLLGSLAVYAYLRRDRSFDPKWFTNWETARHILWPVMLRSAALVVLLGAAVAFLARDRMFLFLKQAPWLWAAVMLLYPVLSVYPQELIFRAFFFQRYRPLFSRALTQVLASAAAFGFVHIVYANWLAVGLSFLGGILFALTYLRTKSLLLVALEHAVFGNFIFTVGLGDYFRQG